jgi:tetratricopeptide (TPR) repeat protein
MDSKAHRDLEKAREHLFALRLVDAYNIFRRYYDRLPFEAEAGHAEYIGLFGRVLYELGKKHELKFYMAALEKWVQKRKSPEILYPLAYIYCDPEGPNLKLALELLDTILKDPDARHFHAKAKILLMYCYDTFYGDVSLCRKVLDSITEPHDIHTGYLLETWRGKVLRDEGRLDEAEDLLKKFIARITHSMDWYAFGVANIILAGVHVKRSEPERARSILRNLNTVFEGKSMKSLRQQMLVVEKELESQAMQGKIFVGDGATLTTLTYQDQTYHLEHVQPTGRLLRALLKEKFLDKKKIVKAIYEREYRDAEDDPLVYYHIHSLRKYMQKMGFRGDIIQSEAGGYRLNACVEERRPI